MIRNAVGTLMRRMAVAATANRTIGRLAARMSRIARPKSIRTTMRGTSRARRTGIRTARTLPGSVSRDHVRPTAAVMRLVPRHARGSLIHSAHDRVEGGHDGHGVRDEVAGDHEPD